MIIQILNIVLLFSFANGHGRLVSPMTRVGHANYESDPVGFFGAQANIGNQLEEWICRHEKNPEVQPTSWTAGSTVELGFNFGVNHVGFCDGMISYDSDKPRSEMKWFKIANFLDCADDMETSKTIVLPDWLPSGNAVFRWSWTALHLYPTIEVFCQCADVVITGTNDVSFLDSIVTYPLLNPQLYPRDGNDGVGYADPYNGDVKDRVVGPACALNFQENECELTQQGTQGYIDPLALASGSSAPTKSPSEFDGTHLPSVSPTTSTAAPVGDCPSGTFISSRTDVPDSWCQDNCALDLDFCLGTGFCHCSSGDVSPAPTAMTTTMETTDDVSPAPTAMTTTMETTTTTTTVAPIPEDDSEYVRVCYFTNWARYRTGLPNVGKDVFQMGFDANLCTHINYGFGTIDPSTFELKAFDPNADHPNGADSQTTLCPSQCVPGYQHDWSTGGSNPCEWPCNPDRELRGFEGLTVGLKRQNPNLKAILSVGGWNFNDCAFTGQAGQGRDSCEIFSTIASTEANSRRHAQHVISFLRNWGFDGYDIDWEYPVVAGHNKLDGSATPQDYDNYIRLLVILREEFEREAQSTQRPRLLLTAAVGVGQTTAITAYSIPAMSQSLDLIGLMTYDFHGTWETLTNFNAPLYSNAEDLAFYDYDMSASWAVDYWLSHGAPADKLVLGFASYGRGWKLQSPDCTTALCPTNGKCDGGVSTKLPGYLASYEIEALIKAGEAVRHWDEERKVPYVITNSNDWIGYDDVESWSIKVDYVKSKNLRGAMVWAIDLDDLEGYPLLNHLKTSLAEDTVVQQTVDPTATPTAQPGTFDSLTRKNCKAIKQWYRGTKPRPGWFDIVDYMQDTWSVDVSDMTLQMAKTEFLAYCASL